MVAQTPPDPYRLPLANEPLVRLNPDRTISIQIFHGQIMGSVFHAVFSKVHILGFARTFPRLTPGLTTVRTRTAAACLSSIRFPLFDALHVHVVATLGTKGHL